MLSFPPAADSKASQDGCSVAPTDAQQDPSAEQPPPDPLWLPDPLPELVTSVLLELKLPELLATTQRSSVAKSCSASAHDVGFPIVTTCSHSLRVEASTICKQHVARVEHSASAGVH